MPTRFSHSASNLSVAWLFFFVVSHLIPPVFIFAGSLLCFFTGGRSVCFDGYVTLLNTSLKFKKKRSLFDYAIS